MRRDSERVAVAVRSKPLLLVSILAVVRAGRSVVLLNPQLPVDTIRMNKREAEAEVVIHDAHYRPLASTLGVQQSSAIDVSNFEWNPAKPVAVTWPRSTPENLWGVVYSSGTTGVPKGIERDHNSIVTEVVGWCLELGLNRETAFYIGRPLYYTGGLVLCLATLLVGGTAYLSDYRDDNDFAEIWTDYQRVVASERLSWAFFIPQQIREFLRLVRLSGIAPQAASSVLVMGAPITGQEKIDARQTLRSEIVESWGNSESLGTITDPEDLSTRPNSVGRPFIGDELCIVDETGQAVCPGERGRIAGGEEAGFSRYSSRPAETERVKRNQLIISDDVGFVDESGYFYVLGRVQDEVIIGGRTVYIPDLEARLRRGEGILDCAIVVPDKTDGAAELVALIVLTQVAPWDALRTECNRLLAGGLSFARVYQVEAIPRLPSGKIDRVAAKRMADNLDANRVG